MCYLKPSAVSYICVILYRAITHRKQTFGATAFAVKQSSENIHTVLCTAQKSIFRSLIQLSYTNFFKRSLFLHRTTSVASIALH